MGTLSGDVGVEVLQSRARQEGETDGSQQQLHKEFVLVVDEVLVREPLEQLLRE